MNIEILQPEGESKIPWPIYQLQKRSLRRVRPPHQLRLGQHSRATGQELRSPKYPLGQTQALRRHGDPITSPRFRHVDDEGRDGGETPDTATTDGEDDHTYKEQSKYPAAAHAASVDDTADGEPHDPDSAVGRHD